MQMDPRSPGPYAALAFLYLGMGNNTQAVEALRQAKQALPDNLNGYWMLDDFYFTRAIYQTWSANTNC